MHNRIDNMHEPGVDLDELYESTLVQIDGDKVTLLVKSPSGEVVAELQAGHMASRSTYGSFTLMEIIRQAAYIYHSRHAWNIEDLLDEYHIEQPHVDR
jgi:hypothetical protein